MINPLTPTIMNYNNNPAEMLNQMLSTFRSLRKEFQDYLDAPMLVACNSVIIVNNDNTMTIGVNEETHTTKINHGLRFPTTFTPEAARRIVKEAKCHDAEGNEVKMAVKNIAVFLREQIASLDGTIETLRQSPYYIA